MTQNICKQCGAPINVKKMLCEFCGRDYAEISISSSKVKKAKLSNPSDSLLLNVLSDFNPPKIISIVLIIFACVWASPCVGISIFMFIQGILMGFVPLAMSFIGISIVITIFHYFKKESISPVTKLLQQKDFKGALTLCHKYENKNNNYNLAYALLAVYKFKQYDKVYEKLKLIPADEVEKAKRNSSLFKEIFILYEI